MASMSFLNHRVYTIINTNNRQWIRLSIRNSCKGPKDAPKPCKPKNKPVSVADRTINLANQNKYCVKPIQRSLVVRPKPCGAKTLRRPITPPALRPIKVCRAGDMKRICPPKPCACPIRKPPETLQEKLKRWLMFLVKAAVTGGVVYWTVEEGVWGTGDEAVELYQSVLSTIMLIYPGAEVEAKEVNIPKTDKMMHQAKQMWNKGVVVVCGFIGKTPGRIMGLIYTPQECIDGVPVTAGSSSGSGKPAAASAGDEDPCANQKDEDDCD